MPIVTIYSTRTCPFCVRAEQFLERKGIVDLRKIMVDADPAARSEMMSRSGRRSVPQIFVGTRHVGGYDELLALDRAGQLEPLLAG